MHTISFLLLKLIPAKLLSSTYSLTCLYTCCPITNYLLQNWCKGFKDFLAFDSRPQLHTQYTSQSCCRTLFITLAYTQRINNDKVVLLARKTIKLKKRRTQEGKYLSLCSVQCYLLVSSFFPEWTHTIFLKSRCSSDFQELTALSLHYWKKGGKTQKLMFCNA